MFQKAQQTNQIRWLLEDPSGFMEAAFGIQTAIVSEEYIKAANITVALTTIQHESAMAETPRLDPSSPPRNPLIGYKESPIGFELGFVCNGEHEAGKSIWSCLILIWRLQCGLPTGYISYGEMWFFFNQEGVTTGSLYQNTVSVTASASTIGSWLTPPKAAMNVTCRLSARFYLVQVTSQTEVGWLCRSKAVSIHTMKSFHASVRGAQAVRTGRTGPR
ncbi:hypothetical protein ARMGADRAFT_1018334 [Armillaria gallica]|uniref:Uncharacterized protein n=1 Tax=Armillaria gallica TaxID=47427 RepID=A0A2H3D6E7_ARMGA|nr:hypothetical protein ARMGADRAFT_1018334 [Armillaria gallica]